MGAGEGFELLNRTEDRRGDHRLLKSTKRRWELGRKALARLASRYDAVLGELDTERYLNIIPLPDKLWVRQYCHVRRKKAFGYE
jgi:hypothetical protein